MPIPTSDPTANMTVDEKIQPNTATAPESFDITVSVKPGHDMVINHLDGAQELGTGNEMLAVTAAEAASGTHVPLSDVQVDPETTHRSFPDPETNQPNPAVDAVTAPAEPVVPVEPETPEVTPEVAPAPAVSTTSTDTKSV